MPVYIVFLAVYGVDIRKDAMTIASPVSQSPQAHREDSTAIRSRDAASTRQLLIQAGRRRFAQDGYSDTKVRDVASDAGVNVALINRYFVSKEGLFEACIAEVGEELGGSAPRETNLDEMVRSIINQLPGNGQVSDQLLLLLRSSGDERADQIRNNIFRSFARRIADAVGQHPHGAENREALLRAQMALSTGLGLILLRTLTSMEPFSSASDDEIRGPLSDALRALLLPGPQ
jgi:AcrR family transcriptional regulator